MESVDFESSDILGGSLPVGRGRVATTSYFSSFIKLCALGACGFLVMIVFRHGRVFFLRWKERHYKLAMRRRYGIPDHDQRPFNVAYAAARVAQEDKRKGRARLGSQSLATVDSTSRFDGQQLRSRLQSTGEDSIATLVGQFSSTPATRHMSDREERPTSYQSVMSSGLIDSPRASFQKPLNPTPPRSRPTEMHRQSSPSDIVLSKDSTSTEETLRTDEATGSEIPVPFSPRKPKRMADSGDDGDLESNQGSRHDKRRRKVSNRQAKAAVLDVEDVEMGDEVSEMELSQRGKKRDRAEAASMYGDDDSSFLDDQDEDRPNRHRRRKQRHSIVVLRGQKRGRDIDASDSESDRDDRRTRGKASRQRHGLSSISDTDVSMDDAQFSHDPLCKGRRIGEEWESYGVQFKVGPNGQRLRKVLVKEDRPKFSMPFDSEHPDRSVSVTAIVERWYNEDEYREAKARHELAWQDSNNPSAEPETPVDSPLSLTLSQSRRRSMQPQDSPLPSGKQLLWGPTSVPASPIRKSNSFGQSVATNVGLRITSLSQAQPQFGRRVTSLYASSMVKPPEMSPKLRSSKSYSKWEKQEIEAEAMARLRRKAEEEQAKKDEEEAKKAAELKKAMAPPAPQPQASTQSSGTSLLAAAPPLSFGPTTETKDKPKTSDTPFKVPFPPSSAPQTNNAGSEKKAEPTASASQMSSPFSFAPSSTPQAVAANANVPPASKSSIPNFFGAKGTAGSSPLRAASSNTTASATASPFSFAPSSTALSIAPASSAPSTAPSSTAPSVFSFKTPSALPGSAPAAKQPDQTNAATSSNTTSLFPAAGSSTTSAQPSFSVTNSQSPFGKPAPANPTPPAPAGSSTGNTSVPGKFDFGLPIKPANAAPQASSTSVFNFGAPKSSSTSAPSTQASTSENPFAASGSQAASTQQAAPKSAFSFGSGSSAESKPASSQPANTSPFGGFGGNSTNSIAPSTSSSTFSNPGATQQTSIFGNNGGKATTSSGTNSTDGNKATSSFSFPPPSAPAPSAPTAPQSAFSFGNMSGGSAALKFGESKSPFSFGGAGSTSTPPAGGNAASPFGSNSNNAGAGAQSKPAPSVLGQSNPIRPSAFGFGYDPPEQASGSFTFGAKTGGKTQ
ncbi:hypothetical protein BV25DRAFT_1986254 [Artomyces pyxidatus]|uniref:Uncharacterized protein n=1 Tax=Artomyces pyxidatus TaxID=48021 RepID=A0ACB8TJM7_9AGAM|nr:hypothetical protein BV25DRAFT_1986254 [Artomyces pyxidatus]